MLGRAASAARARAPAEATSLASLMLASLLWRAATASNWLDVLYRTKNKLNFPAPLPDDPVANWAGINPVFVREVLNAPCSSNSSASW